MLSDLSCVITKRLGRGGVGYGDVVRQKCLGSKSLDPMMANYRNEGRPRNGRGKLSYLGVTFAREVPSTALERELKFSQESSPVRASLPVNLEYNPRLFRSMKSYDDRALPDVAEQELRN